jgi:hypothetical protein
VPTMSRIAPIAASRMRQYFTRRSNRCCRRRGKLRVSCVIEWLVGEFHGL